MTTQEQPAGRPAWRQALRQAFPVALLALAGAAVGYGAASLGEAAGARAELTIGEGLILLALLLPLLLLCILAHELGHIAGGRLAGFRFLLLIVGPLKLQRYGERVRLGLNRSLAMMGGLAASTPRGEHNLPRRMLLMVAAGPAASLIAAALCFGLLALAQGVASVGLLAAGGLNLGLALSTLLPIRTGGFYSDGARILMLLRGGPRAERWCAVGALTNALISGRPRELNPALLARATALPDGTLDDVGAHLLAYYAALDRDEAAGAGAHLDELLGHSAAYPRPARPALLLEGAYYLARHRGDAAGARALLDQSSGGMLIEAHSRRRAEAAVLLVEGRAAEAAAAARDGLERLHALDAGPSAAFDADLLRDLLSQTKVQ